MMDFRRKIDFVRAVCLVAGMIVSGGGTASDATASDGEVTLANGCTIKIISRIDVAVDATREFHGPSVARCSNGDLLLSHQDSLSHGGGDCFVHQWRSTDKGFTWADEGACADHRSQGIDARFGEYGATPDGRLVMMVQLVDPSSGSGDARIQNNGFYTSANNGKTWEYKGLVDPSHQHAVLCARSVFSRDGVMYFGAFSGREGRPLYVSTDNGASWERRSIIFPAAGQPPNTNPPYYPHAIFLPDGKMIAMSYHTPPKHLCYTRYSNDQGRTWGTIKEQTDLPLWAPRLRTMGDGVLMVTGRDLENLRQRPIVTTTVAYFSLDNGETWGDKLLLDRPPAEGSSTAYTDSIQIDDNRFWVFTSSAGNIRGVLLVLCRAQRFE